MIYQELIDRAITEAKRGLAPSVAAAFDEAEDIAEVLVPTVFAEFSAECARDEHRRTLLATTQDLTVTLGSATLPSDVLTEYFHEATLRDPSDLTKSYSFVPFNEFISGQLDQRLGYFTVELGRTFRMIEAGASFNESGGYTGTPKLTAPSAIPVPALAGATVNVVDEIADDLVTALAMALRGEILQEAAT